MTYDPLHNCLWSWDPVRRMAGRWHNEGLTRNDRAPIPTTAVRPSAAGLVPREGRNRGRTVLADIGRLVLDHLDRLSTPYAPQDTGGEVRDPDSGSSVTVQSQGSAAQGRSADMSASTGQAGATSVPLCVEAVPATFRALALISEAALKEYLNTSKDAPTKSARGSGATSPSPERRGTHARLAAHAHHATVLLLSLRLLAVNAAAVPPGLASSAAFRKRAGPTMLSLRRTLMSAIRFRTSGSAMTEAISRTAARAFQVSLDLTFPDPSEQISLLTSVIHREAASVRRINATARSAPTRGSAQKKPTPPKATSSRLASSGIEAAAVIVSSDVEGEDGGDSTSWAGGDYGSADELEGSLEISAAIKAAHDTSMGSGSGKTGVEPSGLSVTDANSVASGDDGEVHREGDTMVLEALMARIGSVAGISTLLARLQPVTSSEQSHPYHSPGASGGSGGLGPRSAFKPVVEPALPTFSDEVPGLGSDSKDNASGDRESKDVETDGVPGRSEAKSPSGGFSQLLDALFAITRSHALGQLQGMAARRGELGVDTSSAFGAFVSACLRLLYRMQNCLLAYVVEIAAEVAPLEPDGDQFSGAAHMVAHVLRSSLDVANVAAATASEALRIAAQHEDGADEASDARRADAERVCRAVDSALQQSVVGVCLPTLATAMCVLGSSHPDALRLLLGPCVDVLPALLSSLSNLRSVLHQGGVGVGTEVTMHEEVVTTTYESAHPYANDEHSFQTIRIPGAYRYTITFDPRTRTEDGHDYVQFFKDSRHVEYWGGGGGKWSGESRGSRMWPGVGHNPPLEIEADSFVFHFHSDESTTDWGYRFTVAARVCRRTVQTHWFSQVVELMGYATSLQVAVLCRGPSMRAPERRIAAERRSGTPYGRVMSHWLDSPLLAGGLRDLGRLDATDHALSAKDPVSRMRATQEGRTPSPAGTIPDAAERSVTPSERAALLNDFRDRLFCVELATQATATRRRFSSASSTGSGAAETAPSASAGPLADAFIATMRRAERFTVTGGDPMIRRAVWAAAAATIYHNGLAGEARNVATGHCTPSQRLRRAWRHAHGVKRLVVIGSDPVAELCHGIGELCGFLLRLTPADQLSEDEDPRHFLTAAQRAATPERGDTGLLVVQFLADMVALLETYGAPGFSGPHGDSGRALFDPVSDLGAVLEARSSRASHRAAGLQLLRALISAGVGGEASSPDARAEGPSATESSISAGHLVWAVSAGTQALQGIGGHPLLGISGCSQAIRSRVLRLFGGLVGTYTSLLSSVMRQATPRIAAGDNASDGSESPSRSGGTSGGTLSQFGRWGSGHALVRVSSGGARAQGNEWVRLLGRDSYRHWLPLLLPSARGAAVATSSRRGAADRPPLPSHATTSEGTAGAPASVGVRASAPLSADAVARLWRAYSPNHATGASMRLPHLADLWRHFVQAVTLRLRAAGIATHRSSRSAGHEEVSLSELARALTPLRAATMLCDRMDGDLNEEVSREDFMTGFADALADVVRDARAIVLRRRQDQRAARRRSAAPLRHAAVEPPSPGHGLPSPPREDAPAAGAATEQDDDGSDQVTLRLPRRARSREASSDGGNTPLPRRPSTIASGSEAGDEERKFATLDEARESAAVREAAASPVELVCTLLRGCVLSYRCPADRDALLRSGLLAAVHGLLVDGEPAVTAARSTALSLVRCIQLQCLTAPKRPAAPTPPAAAVGPSRDGKLGASAKHPRHPRRVSTSADDSSAVSSPDSPVGSEDGAPTDRDTYSGRLQLRGTLLAHLHGLLAQTLHAVCNRISARTTVSPGGGVKPRALKQGSFDSEGLDHVPRGEGAIERRPGKRIVLPGPLVIAARDVVSSGGSAASEDSVVVPHVTLSMSFAMGCAVYWPTDIERAALSGGAAGSATKEDGLVFCRPRVGGSTGGVGSALPHTAFGLRVREGRLLRLYVQASALPSSMRSTTHLLDAITPLRPGAWHDVRIIQRFDDVANVVTMYLYLDGDCQAKATFPAPHVAVPSPASRSLRGVTPSDHGIARPTVLRSPPRRGRGISISTQESDSGEDDEVSGADSRRSPGFADESEDPGRSRVGSDEEDYVPAFSLSPSSPARAWMRGGSSLGASFGGLPPTLPPSAAEQLANGGELPGSSPMYVGRQPGWPHDETPAPVAVAALWCDAAPSRREVAAHLREAGSHAAATSTRALSRQFVDPVLATLAGVTGDSTPMGRASRGREHTGGAGDTVHRRLVLPPRIPNSSGVVEADEDAATPTQEDDDGFGIEETDEAAAAAAVAAVAAAADSRCVEVLSLLHSAIPLDAGARDAAAHPRVLTSLLAIALFARDGRDAHVDPRGASHGDTDGFDGRAHEQQPWAWAPSAPSLHTRLAAIQLVGDLAAEGALHGSLADEAMCYSPHTAVGGLSGDDEADVEDEGTMSEWVDAYEDFGPGAPFLARLLHLVGATSDVWAYAIHDAAALASGGTEAGASCYGRCREPSAVAFAVQDASLALLRTLAGLPAWSETLASLLASHLEPATAVVDALRSAHADLPALSPAVAARVESVRLDTTRLVSALCVLGGGTPGLVVGARVIIDGFETGTLLSVEYTRGEGADGGDPELLSLSSANVLDGLRDRGGRGLPGRSGFAVVDLDPPVPGAAGEGIGRGGGRRTVRLSSLAPETATPPELPPALASALLPVLGEVLAALRCLLTRGAVPLFEMEGDGASARDEVSPIAARAAVPPSAARTMLSDLLALAAGSVVALSQSPALCGALAPLLPHVLAVQSLPAAARAKEALEAMSTRPGVIGRGLYLQRGGFAGGSGDDDDGVSPASVRALASLGRCLRACRELAYEQPRAPTTHGLAPGQRAEVMVAAPESPRFPPADASGDAERAGARWVACRVVCCNANGSYDVAVEPTVDGAPPSPWRAEPPGANAEAPHAPNEPPASPEPTERDLDFEAAAGSGGSVALARAAAALVEQPRGASEGNARPRRGEAYMSNVARRHLRLPHALRRRGDGGENKAQHTSAQQERVVRSSRAGGTAVDVRHVDAADVTSSDLVSESPTTLKVGMRVETAIVDDSSEHGARSDATVLLGPGTGFFPGVIVRDNQDGTFAVAYDDNDSNAAVRREHIRRARPAMRPPPGTSEGAFAVGTRVDTRFGGAAAWFPGRIAGVNASGTYAVAYDDGDAEASVHWSLIRRAQLSNPVDAPSRAHDVSNTTPLPPPWRQGEPGGGARGTAGSAPDEFIWEERDRLWGIAADCSVAFAAEACAHVVVRVLDERRLVLPRAMEGSADASKASGGDDAASQLRADGDLAPTALTAASLAGESPRAVAALVETLYRFVCAGADAEATADDKARRDVMGLQPQLRALRKLVVSSIRANDDASTPADSVLSPVTYALLQSATFHLGVAADAAKEEKFDPHAAQRGDEGARLGGRVGRPRESSHASHAPRRGRVPRRAAASAALGCWLLELTTAELPARDTGEAGQASDATGASSPLADAQARVGGAATAESLVNEVGLGAARTAGSALPWRSWFEDAAAFLARGVRCEDGLAAMRSIARVVKAAADVASRLSCGSALAARRMAPAARAALDLRLIVMTMCRAQLQREAAASRKSRLCQALVDAVVTMRAGAAPLREIAVAAAGAEREAEAMAAFGVEEAKHGDTSPAQHEAGGDVAGAGTALPARPRALPAPVLRSTPPLAGERRTPSRSRSPGAAVVASGASRAAVPRTPPRPSPPSTPDTPHTPGAAARAAAGAGARAPPGQVMVGDPTPWPCTEQYAKPFLILDDPVPADGVCVAVALRLAPGRVPKTQSWQVRVYGVRGNVGSLRDHRDITVSVSGGATDGVEQVLELSPPLPVQKGQYLAICCSAGRLGIVNQEFGKSRRHLRGNRPPNLLHCACCFLLLRQGGCNAGTCTAPHRLRRPRARTSSVSSSRAAMESTSGCDCRTARRPRRPGEGQPRVRVPHEAAGRVNPQPGPEALAGMRQRVAPQVPPAGGQPRPSRRRGSRALRPLPPSNEASLRGWA